MLLQQTVDSPATQNNTTRATRQMEFVCHNADIEVQGFFQELFECIVHTSRCWLAYTHSIVLETAHQQQNATDS